MIRLHNTIPGLTIGAALSILSGFHDAAHAQAFDSHDVLLRTVVANDNRRPAGILDQGVLTLDLRAGSGLLHPEGDSRRGLPVEALGEKHSPLSAPAPLIRVPEGAEIHATIPNDLSHPLRMNGLCDRTAPSCAPIEVPAGETRQVRFRSGPAGTRAPRSLPAGAGEADHRRRRNVRLRGRDAARSCGHVDRRTNGRRQMADAGPGDRQMKARPRFS